MIIKVGLMTGPGMLVLFSLLWLFVIRKKADGRRTAGDWANALGFGLLPGIAVWKAFEQYSGIRTVGRELFEPLKAISWFTADGRFVPCRIEFCAATAAFILVTVWLIVRRDRLPGNGDLLLTVVCIWSAVRSVTECLRRDTLRIGPLNAVIIAAVAAEIICMWIWTVRRGKKEKSAGLTIPEWVAAIACGAVILLQEAKVLSLDSPIANLAVTVGCGLLGLTLILMAGKDSRDLWVTGETDSPPSDTIYNRPAGFAPPGSSSPPEDPTVRLDEVPDGQKTIQYVPGSGDAPRGPNGTAP